MTRDPIGTAGGANLYGYVGGDPVNGSDPSGLRKGGAGPMAADEMDIASMPTPENHNGGDGGYHGPFAPPAPPLVVDVCIAPSNVLIAPVVGNLGNGDGTDNHLYGGIGLGFGPPGGSIMQTDGPIASGEYWQFSTGYVYGLSISRRTSGGSIAVEIGPTTRGAWFGVITVK